MSYGGADAGRVAQLKGDVNQVQGLMKSNLHKIADRGDKLEDIEGRAEQLSHGAKDFSTSAVRLKRKLWWQNVKLWIILIIIILVILAVIIIIIVVSVKSQQN